MLAKCLNVGHINPLTAGICLHYTVPAGFFVQMSTNILKLMPQLIIVLLTKT